MRTLSTSEAATPQTKNDSSKSGHDVSIAEGATVTGGVELAEPVVVVVEPSEPAVVSVVALVVDDSAGDEVVVDAALGVLSLHDASGPTSANARVPAASERIEAIRAVPTRCPPLVVLSDQTVPRR